MSLYHHSHGYGHNPYPSAGYNQPPVQTVQLGPPPSYYPPAALYFADPNSFRREYVSRLSELQVNSRPIIQNLSMIAQDNVRFSDIVAQCLETHIRRVPPWMKLPAFYLLDAISKNVYEPYAAKFSVFVVPLFLETYGQVDQNTRSKMEEMLVTWRTGSPTGKELFGVAPQVAIERSVWGNDSSSTFEKPNRRTPHSPSITKSQVLAELEVTLAQKERLVYLNPYDNTSRNHVNVLHQLRKMVEAGVSQEELSQILTQLRALARDAAIALPPPTQPPPVHAAYPTNVESVPTLSANIGPPHSAPLIESIPPAQPSTVPAPTTGPPSAVPNISDLFNSLLKAGLVSSSSNTPTGAGKEGQTENQPVETQRDIGRKEYGQSILGIPLKLTTAEITKQQPQINTLLYERLGTQCKQCAMRFYDTPAGKKDMDNHLDMHFRQNRKANQGSGRGHSRSWFVGFDSWVRDLDEDVKGKGRAGVSTNITSGTSEDSVTDSANLCASYVVVPPGDEAKNISCPICKESLKSEFMEDDEEWVWQNAVRVKDKIFHATCHAEMASSATLAARLRSETGTASGSRSGTPELESGRSTPPPKHLAKLKLRASESPTPDTNLTGTKRKAEGDGFDALSNDVSRRTPPQKKIAVS